jgi:crotonobetainyl-CoA:carnitine CoA-transferase CaiB-like acyl-CoA transferase
MTRTLTLVTLFAAAALAGCKEQNHTIQAGPADPMGDALANAAPIELPPAIAASKIYRCKDNSLVYIDWLADKITANFRTERTGTPVQLKAPAAGEALIAEGGYSLTGDAAAATVTLARPGAPSQSCKA